jgi:hypothetical protein
MKDLHAFSAVNGKSFQIFRCNENKHRETGYEIEYQTRRSIER